MNETRESKLLSAMLSKMKSQHPHGPNADMTAIAFDKVGNHDLDYTLPEGEYKTLYPDWHMITPAYKLRNSGMSGWELFKSLFTYNDKNNLKNRLVRFATEKKAIVYSNGWDKLSTAVNILLILLTLFIAISCMTIGARSVYEFSDSGHRSDKEKKWLAVLNSIAVERKVLLGAQIGLTGILAFVTTVNIFKRTTVPVNGTIVNSLDRQYPITKRTRQLAKQASQRILNIKVEPITVDAPLSDQIRDTKISNFMD